MDLVAIWLNQINFAALLITLIVATLLFPFTLMLTQRMIMTTPAPRWKCFMVAGVFFGVTVLCGIGFVLLLSVSYMVRARVLIWFSPIMWVARWPRPANDC